MERRFRVQLWRDVAGRALNKKAELAETYTMTSQSPPSRVHDPKKNSKFGVRKTAARVFEDALLGNEPEDQPAMSEVPAHDNLRPHVDVTGLEPPHKMAQAASPTRFALPEKGLYPLDTYGQVKRAADYFTETHRFMPPEVKHEYCCNLVSRADELDIPVSELIQKYGSTTYAPEHEMEMCLAARRESLIDEDQRGILDKLAEQRHSMEPEQFATTLGEFDKLASLDSRYGTELPDPYFTTFGKQALQEAQKTPSSSVLLGNEHLPAGKLEEFASRGSEALVKRFGPEFLREFQKDPRAIFDSLPRDQRLVIMRMANTSDAVHLGASGS